MSGDIRGERVRCPRCNEPFHTERLRDLHLGYEHGGLDSAEREAFEEAYREESAEIRRFRLKVIGALVVLYFGLLFVYVFVS
jgi:hypothetical protein